MKLINFGACSHANMEQMVFPDCIPRSAWVSWMYIKGYWRVADELLPFFFWPLRHCLPCTLKTVKLDLFSMESNSFQFCFVYYSFWLIIKLQKWRFVFLYFLFVHCIKVKDGIIFPDSFTLMRIACLFPVFLGDFDVWSGLKYVLLIYFAIIVSNLFLLVWVQEVLLITVH